MSQVPSIGRIVIFHIGVANWPAMITRVVDVDEQRVNLHVFADDADMHEKNVRPGNGLPEGEHGDKRWSWPPRT